MALDLVVPTVHCWQLAAFAEFAIATCGIVALKDSDVGNDVGSFFVNQSKHRVPKDCSCCGGSQMKSAPTSPTGGIKCGRNAAGSR